jgi:hypothetical protein
VGGLQIEKGFIEIVLGVMKITWYLLGGTEKTTKLWLG